MDGNEHLGAISDSFKEFLHGIYSKAFSRSYRAVGTSPAVTQNGSHTNVNEVIDASVFDRWRDDEAYRPPNLVDCSASMGVDLALSQTMIVDEDIVIFPWIKWHRPEYQIVL